MKRSLCVGSMRWAISWMITYSRRSLGFFTSSVLRRIPEAGVEVSEALANFEPSGRGWTIPEKAVCARRAL
jgi:hypothetical protein